MAYRKSWIRGRKCLRRKRVKMRGNGYVMRCAKYGPKRGGGSRSKKRSKSRKRRTGYRKGHAPFNRGRRCVEKGLNKRGIVTCRSYGAVYGDKKKNRRRSRPRPFYGPDIHPTSGAYTGRGVEPGSWYNRLRQRMAA